MLTGGGPVNAVVRPWIPPNSPSSYLLETVMRPLIFDLLFHDDRMFVLELSVVESANDGSVNLSADQNALRTKEWAVVTRRNVPGYPPVRVDRFPTRVQAVEFYKATIVSTPRKSAGEQSPEPLPTLEEYAQWLAQENLFDPLLNPHGKRPDA
jgi:hypothetical protein